MRKLYKLNYIRYYVALCLLLCTSILAGCSGTDGYINFSEAQSKEIIQDTVESNADYKERTLRVAFASVISPQKTRESYQIMVNELSMKLHRPVTLMQRKTYKELNELLSNGEVDIAFLSTGAYSSYRGAEPIEMLAMIQTNNTILYHTYLIVPKDSDIENFSDLEGKTFAFTDPLSYSGRLVIDYLLLAQNTTPEKYFSHYFYTYNHDKSIWAVANHLADAASIDSQIYDYMEYTNPHLLEKIKIIAKLNDAPTGPVVIRSSISPEEKAQLQQIFFHMHETENMKIALQDVLIDQFVPPQPDLYKDLKSKYNIIYNLPED